MLQLKDMKTRLNRSMPESDDELQSAGFNKVCQPTSGLDQGVLDLKCWLDIEVQPVQQMALSSGEHQTSNHSFDYKFCLTKYIH